MDNQKNNGMCRCCASEGTFKDVKTAYQWMGEEEVYAEMLRECLDISLCPDDAGEVEGGICEVCITQLRNASNFKKQVLHTEEQFKRSLQEGLFKSDIVKVEVAPTEGESDNDNDMSEDYGTEFEVPVKTETVEEPKAKKRGAKAIKASTSRVKKLKAEDGESSKRITSRNKSKKVTKTALRKARSAAMRTVRAHKKNLLKILMFSNANPIRDKDMLQGIQCHYCKTKMKESQNLKEHFVKEHRNEEFITSKMKDFLKTVWKLDITDLRCEVCDYRVETIKDLIKHFSSAHGMDVETDVEDIFLPFKFNADVLLCAICNVEFPVFKLLREHMNNHFMNFVCDICNAGYVTNELLYRHKIRHQVSENSCPICEKVFSSKPRVNQHIKIVHFNNKRYKCNYCDERFIEFNMKLRHMKKVHDKNLGLSCQICDKMFVTPSSLRMHVRSYHLCEKRFLCSVCGKRFFTKSLLRNHREIHRDFDSLTCDICLAEFLSKSRLREHIRAHIYDDEKRSGKPCLFCSKVLSTEASLKLHIENLHSNLFGP